MSNRDTNDSETRRATILGAAQGVFDARGFEAATVDGIAEKAGVSKGTIYNYFKNKEDLFTEVFKATLFQDHTDVDRLVSEDVPASEKLKRLLEFVFARVESFTRSGRLVLELWATAARQGQETELAEALAQRYSHWRQHLRTILEEGVERGEFGHHFEPAVAASLIWATLNGIIVQALFEREPNVDEHSLAALERGLLAGLKAWSATDNEP